MAKKFTEKQIAAAAAVIVDGPDGHCTLTDYLKALLGTLWVEAEEFSGKRPFGDSGWQFDVYKALIKAELVKGKLDDEGYVDTIGKEHDGDTREADVLVLSVIKRFNVKTS